MLTGNHSKSLPEIIQNPYRKSTINLVQTSERDEKDKLVFQLPKPNVFIIEILVPTCYIPKPDTFINTHMGHVGCIWVKEGFRRELSHRSV